MSSAQVRSGPGVPCCDLTLSHAPLDFSYVTPRNWRDGVSMPGEAARPVSKLWGQRSLNLWASTFQDRTKAHWPASTSALWLISFSLHRIGLSLACSLRPRVGCVSRDPSQVKGPNCFLKFLSLTEEAYSL